MLSAVALVAAAVACGGASTDGAGSAAAPPPLGPLPLLVPSGATLIVTARPPQLMAAGASRRVIDAVFDGPQRDAFARRTGVEPDELEELVVAEFPNGFLILARGPWAARDLVVATAARMNSVEVSAESPFVRRAGFLGTERRDITAIDEHTVLFTAGLPDVTAQILGRLRSRRAPETVPETAPEAQAPAANPAGDPGAAEPNAPPPPAALAAADLRPLFTRHHDAALAVYGTTPLALPPGLGTSLLLARQRALVAVAAAGPEGSVAFGVELVGEFPPGASSNFETLVRSMAATDLGAALGMREGIETLRIHEADDGVVLGLEVPAESLAMGLRLLFGGEIAELLAAPIQ